MKRLTPGGDHIFESWAGWNAGLKKRVPNGLIIEGDKDIAQAFAIIFQNGKAKRIGVGEWDGAKGVFYSPIDVSKRNPKKKSAHANTRAKKIPSKTYYAVWAQRGNSKRVYWDTNIGQFFPKDSQAAQFSTLAAAKKVANKLGKRAARGVQIGVDCMTVIRNPKAQRRPR